MTADELEAAAREFTLNSPDNRVPADKAHRPRIAGMQIFDEPILGYARPDDGYFLALKEDPAAFMAEFERPSWWLPEARTVIALYLPFTERVRKSNLRDMDWPSQEWLNARIEGQEFIRSLTGHLAERLAQAGFSALAPFFDPRFWYRSVYPNEEFPVSRAFTSNWSERHIAYACGLGTFSLSTNLITKKGTAGRFGSLVTSLALPVVPRPYSSLYEYCCRCGACARNCPMEAITKEGGKDMSPCKTLLGQTRAAKPPYYGCGKCQVGVPCETGIPKAMAV